MEGKEKRALDRLAASERELAEKVAPDTIGKAVLVLLEQGKELTFETLLMALQGEAGRLQGLRNQAAQKALQAARTSAT